jgi:hypothetical protein
MGHKMADRSSNEADFLCILLYLAWRLWKSVVTLAVTGNTLSGQVFLFQRVPEFKGHRLPLTGSRCDIRTLIGRRTNPTFCVIFVFSVAVMEKCSDACFHGDYYFRSGFSASEAAGVSVASTVVDRKSMGQTVADRSSNEADFLCILLYLAWRLWKRVVTVAVKGNTIFGWVFRRQRVL